MVPKKLIMNTSQVFRESIDLGASIHLSIKH